MTTTKDPVHDWRLIAMTTTGHGVTLNAGLDEEEAKAQLQQVVETISSYSRPRTIAGVLAVILVDSIEAVSIKNSRSEVEG